jgi:hypothetical protein
MAKPRRRIVRFQRRIPGVRREALPSCVFTNLHRAVEQDASRYGVSRSWVVAVILAAHYQLTGVEPYDK